MAAPYVRIHPLQEGRAAIDVLTMADLNVLAETEYVGVGYVDAGGVGAAAAAEGDTRLQGPDVVGDDQDVDHVVVVADRTDGRVAQKRRIQANVALGLVEQPARIQVAAAKQQLRGDGRDAGALVQMVGGAKQPVVVLRVAQIEHLDGIDLDAADARAGGFKLLARRHRIAAPFLRYRRFP